MYIDVAKILKSEGKKYFFELEETLESEIFSDLELVTPAKVKCCVEYDGQFINVQGTLVIDITLACDRCLNPYRYSINQDFDERFALKQIAEKDEEIYVYTGLSICLDKLLHDIIILNYPAKCLCDPDCKGLLQE